MKEVSIGDLIILKQKLKECFDNNEMKEAEMILKKINEICEKIGNIKLENFMSEEEKYKIQELFNS